jgi:hypothetical protein
VVVDGSIARFRRYTIDDGGKSITFDIETSTFPNWNGTTTYTVATPSGGGAPLARHRAGIDLLMRSTMSGGTKFTSSVVSASTSST